VLSQAQFETLLRELGPTAVQCVFYNWGEATYQPSPARYGAPSAHIPNGRSCLDKPFPFLRHRGPGGLGAEDLARTFAINQIRFARPYAFNDPTITTEHIPEARIETLHYDSMDSAAGPSDVT